MKNASYFTVVVTFYPPDVCPESTTKWKYCHINYDYASRIIPILLLNEDLNKIEIFRDDEELPFD